jgi:hypothetical protein
MSSPDQPKRHIPAHPSDANHTELHIPCSFPQQTCDEMLTKSI